MSVFQKIASAFKSSKIPPLDVEQARREMLGQGRQRHQQGGDRHRGDGPRAVGCGRRVGDRMHRGILTWRCADARLRPLPTRSRNKPK